MRFVFVVPALVALVAGCTITTTNEPAPVDTGTPDAGGTTPEAAAPTPATVPFQLSNLKLDGVDASKLGDVVVSHANCTFHTETKEVSCIDNDLVQYVTVDQPGAGKIGMYVAKSVRVEPNARIVPKGTFALAIVALESFDVQGTIDVSADRDYATAGGFVHGTSGDVQGAGPGGGGAGSTTNGAGGGGYCGAGGKGAALTTGGTPAAGGAAYGTPENVPLVGGSTGGAGTLPNSGSGGGAVQLVAGTTFTLGANGIVAAGGGGGAFVGAAGTQHGSGGGSGGAILIEAPTVTLAGSLLAEGGAGGAKDFGQNAQLSSTAAESAALANGSLGGSGSGGGQIDGGDATALAGDNAPGGGGGAGRIRINSTSGASTTGAKHLSPNVGSTCLTEGTLAAP
ncbi:MAG: hypothetical protein KIT84_27445 [Labilithrix sp.]|nr:hypothetical protein [Labilithrix sp.]MCW5814793.1 hypothetical protein [Labilithrix sp.]